MGILSSFFRYIRTLGGLIESDIDGTTDSLVTTPTGIKATFAKTRQEWSKQYAEVREAVAQLMMVLDQKTKQIDALAKEAEGVKVKMKGAVEQYRKTNEPRYQQAFTELFNRDNALTGDQEQLNAEVQQLKSKIDTYKSKLQEMQKHIDGLKKQESEAIADIVSSKQIIKLNDRLSNLSTELDDRNVRAIEERRHSLVTQAKLSGELAHTEQEQDLEEELLAAGMQSEAADVFAAMLSEGGKETAEREEDKTDTARTRAI